MKKQVYVILLLFKSLQVKAQHAVPTELWTRFTLALQQSTRIRQDFELQYRNQYANELPASGFKLTAFRWYIHFIGRQHYFQISPVTYFYRRPDEGHPEKEFRLMQLFGKDLFNSRLQFRTGLEERFFFHPGGSSEEVRWRNRIRFSVPVTDNLTLHVSDELFLHRRFSGSQVPWLDHNRINILLEIKWGNVLWEPGYSFQLRKNSNSSLMGFHVIYLNGMLLLKKQSKESSV